MNEILEFSFTHLFQATFLLTVSVVVAAILIKFMRARPSTRVAIWMLVLMQSWLLFSIVIEIPWYEPVSQVTTTTGLPSLEVSNNYVSLPTQALVTEAQFNFPSIPMAIVTFWVFGVLFLTAGYLRNFRLLCRTVSRFPVLNQIDHPLASRWKLELERVQLELSIVAPVTLRVSNQLGPLIVRNAGQYSLVVPETYWADQSATHRIAILRHELSHIKRGDVWKTLSARLLILPQWFNPLAWLALRRFDASIEMACDEYVLNNTPSNPIDYAKSLVSLVEFNQSHCGVALAAGGPPIQERIQRIIQPKGLEMKYARMLAIVSLFSIAMFGLFRLELVAQETKPETVLQAQKFAGSSMNVEANAAQSNDEQSSHDQPTSKRSKAGHSKLANDGRMVTKSYDVFDLVVPYIEPLDTPIIGAVGGPGIPGGISAVGVTQRDFDPIRELVEQTVAPESWKKGGGKGTVEAFVPNLALIVRTTEKNHAAIQDRLTKICELPEVRIKLKSFLAIVPEGHEILKELNPEKPKLTDAKSMEAFRSLKLLSTYTYFNGQMTTFRSLKHEGVELERLTIQPMLTASTSDDPAYVTLSCSSAEATRLLSGKPNAQPNEKTETSSPDKSTIKMTGQLEVPDKSFALFDVTEFMENPPEGKRAVVVIYTKIIEKRIESTKIPAPKVLKR